MGIDLIDSVPKFIDKNVMNSTVEDALADYQDKDGNISQENFNKFIKDSVKVPFGLGNTVAKEAGGIFDSMNANNDDVVSIDELSNFLYNCYGVKYDEIQNWDVSELVSHVIDVEKGEATVEETKNKMAKKQQAKAEKNNSDGNQFSLVNLFNFFKDVFLSGGKGLDTNKSAC